MGRKGGLGIFGLLLFCCVPIFGALAGIFSIFKGSGGSGNSGRSMD